MKYYYYPLCTKDFAFENIFASESISPISFYKNRGFGIDYFYKIPKVHHDEALILYNEPPKYQTGIDNKSVIKFILQIAESSIDLKNIISLNGGLIAYQKTIYLSKKNFNILFFTEMDKTITCLKSETSLPTKGLKKFRNNFKVISESDCKQFDLLNIELLKIDNTQANSAINFDRIFNSYKGFIYGVVTGIAGGKSKEEVALTKCIQEINNGFAELKNRVENKSREPIPKYSKSVNYSESSLKLLQESLTKDILFLEKLFFEVFTRPVISDEEIAKFLMAKYEKFLPTLEEAKRYLAFKRMDDEIFGTNCLYTIRQNYSNSSGKQDTQLYFDLLKNACTYNNFGLKYKLNSNRNNIDSSDEIQTTLNALSKLIDENVMSKSSSRKVDLESIHYNSLKNEIEIQPGYQSLPGDEIRELILIANAIFKTPKVGKGEAKKDHILSIVEQVGDGMNKAKGGKQTHLYKYLNNEVSEYTIERASSIVMKNFVAFVFNPDSFEKLANFSEKKELEKEWIGYSFWCVFNGFSNISRNFVKAIFDTTNGEIQDYIDTYLQSIFSNLIIASNEVRSFDVPKTSLPDNNAFDSKIDGVISAKIKEFYEKGIKDRFKISLEEFSSIVHQKDEEKILIELKKKGIPKKDGKKLITSFNKFISSSILFE